MFSLDSSHQRAEYRQDERAAGRHVDDRSHRGYPSSGVAQRERELDAVIDRYEELLAAENPQTVVDDGAVEIEFESEEPEPGIGARIREKLSRLF